MFGSYTKPNVIKMLCKMNVCYAKLILHSKPRYAFFVSYFDS